jgi:branched-chain amino acid transport system permease protein
VPRYKLAVFTLAGAVAALAGSLSAQHTAFISPELLTWTTSGEVLIVVIVGGMGSLIGPVVGAAVVVLATHYISGFTDYWMMFMGLFFIAVVVFAGNGLYGTIEAVRILLSRSTRAPR